MNPETDCLANQIVNQAQSTPGEQAEARRIARHIAQWGPDRAGRLRAEQAARLANDGT